ncbi:MAG: branched-chain amino acid transaminase [Firmicutes bacterium]|jgi:branched-chain amino acid aminotransferase|nr:branched-chain amino acid transaminase [Bacillota bacterium]MDH7496381.1 branched-chain amino acid transaminase [Bacillota bacterium]
MAWVEGSYIWFDGDFVKWEDAKIHVLSHVVHYGSGVFEGIRAYKTPAGTAVFRLGDHVARLYDSAKIYRMDIPYSQDEIARAIIETVRRNGFDSCYIRPLVFRGYHELGLNPLRVPVQTMIAVWGWGSYLAAGAGADGVDVVVSSWNRLAPNTLPPLAKACGNYINSQLMKMQAVVDGYHEAIAVGTDGLLSEATGENLFVVRGGTIYTPQLASSILNGITRNTILTLARDLGIPAVEQPLPREILYVADEVFLTGTAAEITPVRSVDRIPVGNGEMGPITRRLKDAFFAIIGGKAPDSHSWLTPVRDAGGPGRFAS